MTDVSRKCPLKDWYFRKSDQIMVKRIADHFACIPFAKLFKNILPVCSYGIIADYHPPAPIISGFRFRVLKVRAIHFNKSDWRAVAEKHELLMESTRVSFTSSDIIPIYEAVNAYYNIPD